MSELLNRVQPQVRVGVAVFVFRDGKFLMAKRKGSHGEGTWSIPGGHVDFGESPEEAVAREVFEEVGLRIGPPKFWSFTNDLFEKEGKHYITLWYFADWLEGEASIKEPEKCSEIGWFDFSVPSFPPPLFQPCWENLIKQGLPDGLFLVGLEQY